MYILITKACIHFYTVLSSIWVLLRMRILSCTITLHPLGVYLQVISMFYLEYTLAYYHKISHNSNICWVPINQDHLSLNKK